MSNTQHRSVRIHDTRWAALGREAARLGTSRADVLNALAAYWLREPGAKLPRRPPEPDAGE